MEELTLLGGFFGSGFLLRRGLLGFRGFLGSWLLGGLLRAGGFLGLWGSLFGRGSLLFYGALGDLLDF